VEYDDVVNNQRKIIYGERRKILSGADLKANVLSMVDDEISDIINGHIGENRDGNTEALVTEVGSIMALPQDFKAEAIAEMKPVDKRAIDAAGRCSVREAGNGIRL
jgi:preprotein translocase subunit SecA